MPSVNLIPIIFISIALVFSVEANAGKNKNKNKNKNAISLTNDDFLYGTYIIDTPGIYRLKEDITFNPNSVETLSNAVLSGDIPASLAASMNLTPEVEAFRSGFPLFTQFSSNTEELSFTPGGPLDRRYDPSAYGLGFFAAIAIEAENVVLDLNGHTIQQSPEHALLQRFFAIIELADRPFIPAQGPHNFGASIESAKNVTIKDGVIGLSAHHGIHGNGNSNIRVKNVDFEDFEVAAIALNGVNGLTIKNSNAENRKDVPVIGAFSAIQFIKPYVDELIRNNTSTTLELDAGSLQAGDILQALRTTVNAVYEDVILNKVQKYGRTVISEEKHPLEYALFHNKHGIIDGNSYSFLVNHLGAAVNGFPLQPDSELASRNIWFEDVHASQQHAFINEIVALNQGGAVIDPVGSVFQIFNTHPDSGEPLTVSSLNPEHSTYVGNPIANAQAFVAKAHLNGEFEGSNLDVSRMKINQNVLNWVEAKPGFEVLASIAKHEDDFLCNGDSMFHVNKGVIGFKIDGAKNVVLRNTSATDLLNLGKKGSTICGDYSNRVSHPGATLPGYGGAKTRAYTFAGSKNIILDNSSALELKASEGSVTGVAMLTDSKRLKLSDIAIIGVEAGFDSDSYTGVNEQPEATGFYFSEQSSRIIAKEICAEMMDGFAGEAVFKDDSESAYLKRVCK